MEKQQIKIKSRIDEFEADIFIPDNWDNKKLVICNHGFNSGKNGESYVIIGKALLQKGIAYAIFSLPYHAERRKDANDFTVSNCLEDGLNMEKAIREKFPNTKIGILGTSFGGYLTLLKLKNPLHDYFAVVLKSPAIKMDEILSKNLTGEEFEVFKKQGYAIDDHKSTPMRINFSFYEDLIKHRIMDNPKYEDKILIYHGTIDDTAPYEDSKTLADMNENITLVSLENENHKFSIDVLDRFSEEVANYFKNEK